PGLGGAEGDLIEGVAVAEVLDRAPGEIDLQERGQILPDPKAEGKDLAAVRRALEKLLDAERQHDVVSRIDLPAGPETEDGPRPAVGGFLAGRPLADERDPAAGQGQRSGGGEAAGRRVFPED